MKNKYIFSVMCILAILSLCGVISCAYAANPVLPAPNPLPTIDPQARQILATMDNMYQFGGIEEYADEETIVATGDTKIVSSDHINSRYTVALSLGDGLLLTATDASGEKVTVHAFQKGGNQMDRPFLVLTTDSRYPGLYVRDMVTNYEEAQAHSFSRSGMGAFGAGVLFSQRDIASLLFNPSFQGLRLGQPLVVAGVTCDTLMIDLNNERGNNTMTLCIGQKDHLLRRLTMTHVQGAQTTIVTENHTHIRTQGFPPTTSMLFPWHYFEYAPPRGYRLVSAFPYPAVPTHPAIAPTATPDKSHGLGK